MRSKLALRRSICFVIGSLAFVLGGLGLFLPILPTTPFMLLAAYCFARSSARVYYWLLTHPLFGFKLYSFSESRAIPRGVKKKIFLLLWCSLCASAFIVPFWWLRGLLLVVGIAVTLHVARFRTIPPDELEENRKQYLLYKEKLERKKMLIDERRKESKKNL